MSITHFSHNICLTIKLLLLINIIVPTKTDEYNHKLQYAYVSSPSPEFPPKFSNKPFIFDNKLYLPPDTQTQTPPVQFLPPKDQTVLNAFPNIFEQNADWPGQLNGMFVETPDTYQSFTQAITTMKPKEDGKNEVNFKSNFSLNNRGPQHPLPETITRIPYTTTTRAIPTPAITARVDYQPDLLVTPRSSYSAPVNNVGRALIHQNGAEFNPQAKVGEQLPDQYHTATSQQANYAQGYNVAPLPGVPILRQISEMDLDGSFSYESLTGDQTHVVQQGHVENLGTEKEEQVVQGSYSYVGDDGQTYTVHYIADGNGFRATGDHLPVAPPIPEIIQRSVQYNMEEEAKKPQSPQHYHNFHDLDDSVTNRPIPVPPQKAFFQTKPPAAFSVNDAGATSSQNNALQASGSNQYMKYQQAPPSYTAQSPQKASPRLYSISPQLTFPASQGAYVPASPIQTTRTYTPSSTETPRNSFGTPQPSTTISYIAPHTETEHSSSLWQYQRTYLQNGKNIPDKSSISRSGDYIDDNDDDDDDVLINFEDMSPEDYAKAYFNHIAPQDATFKNNDVNLETVIRERKQNVIVPPTNGIRDITGRNSIITVKSFLPEPQTVTSTYYYQPNQENDVMFKTNRENQININNYDELTMQEINPQNHKQATDGSAHNSQIPSEISNGNNVIFKSRESANKNHMNFNGIINNNNNIQAQNENIATNNPTDESNTLPFPTMKPNELNTKKNNVPSKIDQLDKIQPKHRSKLNKTIVPEFNMMEAIKQNLFLKPILEKKAEKMTSSHNIISKKSEISKEQLISEQKPLENIKVNHKHTKFADEINSNKLDLAQIITLLNVKSNFESSKLNGKPESNYINFKYEPSFDNKQTQNKQEYNVEGPRDNSNWEKTNYNQFKLENNPSEKTVNEARKKIYTTLQRNRPTGYSEDYVKKTEVVSNNRYKDLNNKFERSLPTLGRAGPSQKIYTPPQIRNYR